MRYEILLGSKCIRCGADIPPAAPDTIHRLGQCALKPAVFIVVPERDRADAISRLIQSGRTRADAEAIVRVE